jgi:alpha-tubulin suppressor-like RCC1 family protein
MGVGRIILCSASLSAVTVAFACSSFEPNEEPPAGDAAADVVDDSCVLCNQDGPTSTDAGPDAQSSDPVEQISGGGTFACGRRKSKTVVCWGDNSEGQIGQSPDGDLACDLGARCRGTPIEVPGLADVVEVSAGFRFACARLANGSVSCWGDNGLGQLGLGVTVPVKRFTPAIVPNLPGPALEVTTGLANACARVMEAGKIEVYCWGSNRRALLGTAFSETVGPATRIAGLTGAKKVSMGVQADTACAIASDDTVLCWGRNAFGSTGHTPNTNGDVICSPNGEPCNPQPLPVGTSSFTAKDLYVGFHTVCVLDLNGSVACWGWNYFGGLGQATDDNQEHPAPTVVNLGGPATALSLRHHHVCALVSGVVRCWGGNPYGELGNKNMSDFCLTSLHPCKSTPQTTSLPSPVVRIALGMHASFATTEDGRDWAWGLNGDGRLGHAPGDLNDQGGCANGFRCNPNPQLLTFP